MSRKEKLLVLGDIFRFRLEWKQEPHKVNARRIPRIEQLSIVRVKQRCAQ